MESRGATATIRQLHARDELFSSNLMEAELRASLVRENVSAELEMLSWISWVLPDRPLALEIERVLAAGYLRGADLWHVAGALYLAKDPKDIWFITLDHLGGVVQRRGHAHNVASAEM